MQLLQSHILIVDDDNKILILLKKFFKQNGFLVSTANSVMQAEELLLYYFFDLIILDVMLPGITGIEFAKNIKASGNTTMPIIMLTSLSEPADRIRGLEAGALDYLTKPFEPKELLLRANNLIESYRQYKKEKEITRFGNNFYDFNSKEFIKKEQNIKLSTTEQMLLEILIEQLSKVISREELSDKMGAIGLRSVDVLVARIRVKIEDNPKEPKYLKTIRGHGYVLYT